MSKTLILGTFNKFHKGHRAIIDKAFEFSDTVVVGVYVDMIAKHLPGKEGKTILPYETRVHRIVSYIKNNYPDGKFEILELMIKGHMSEMRGCSRIVLSNGGITDAQRINMEQMICEEQPLELVYIPPIRDEMGRILSSENILSKQIDENGNLNSHMEVTFLGTSGGSSSLERASAGVLIKTKKGAVLLDCGNETALQLKKAKINPVDIDAIFISHNHMDHFIGLPILVMHDMMLADRHKRLGIHGPSKLLEMLKTMFVSYDIQPKFHIDYIAIDRMEEFNYFGLKVKKFKSIHTVDAYGFIVIDENGYSVTYTGDTSYNPDLKTLAKNTDLLIHEATYMVDDNNPRYCHSTIEDALRVAKETNAKSTALIHISMKYHGNMEKYFAEVFDISKERGVERVYVPSDLLTFTVRNIENR